jgi:Flp pilus assembly pilin Flp
MSHLKSQTATEYLVILGVVIAIAIITVSSLSDVVGLGGGMDEKTARLTLSAQEVKSFYLVGN